MTRWRSTYATLSTATRATVALDLLRGAAAAAVLFQHTRGLLIQSRGDAPVTVLSKAFYMASGFGQAAVMVFFVMSGLLISSSILRSARGGRTSWKIYLINRVSRLQVVLLPALLLTLLVDQATLSIVKDRVGNSDTALAIIDTPTMMAASTPIVFLGNACFLQNIAVPTFGSNTALWSLANEFWYYIIFPCAWVSLTAAQSLRVRALSASAAIALLIAVGWRISSYFPVWLMGTALAFAPVANEWRPSGWLRASSAIPLALAMSLIALGRLPHGFAANYAVASTFTLWLWVLLQDQRAVAPGVMLLGSRAIANCSYSLYAIHLPLLIMLRACFTFDEAWPDDFWHWSAVIFLCAATQGIAFLFSRVTEARTAAVRDWLVRATAAA